MDYYLQRQPVESSEAIILVNHGVLPPDPHGFDGDNDGIGCESC